MADVFAFVAFKPCGCWAEVCTPHALDESMKKKWFREQMLSGKVKTVATRAEYLALPYRCAECAVEPKKKRKPRGSAAAQVPRP